ncbi:type III toxin-antitoxin system ToxN/AbiQ family toxin [bacterium]|mgnify:CR=1 FL=1|nr:type III toxin-antitoxin system ToxN/AbiQ family toxin [bacterium]
MARTLKIYYLDEKYINYLRKYDTRVAYNKNQKRPYIGVVYTFNGLNYFAPLAHPRPKHLKMNDKAIDIFKIDDGKLGVVNINNMIPTPIECITEVLPTITDDKYKILIQNQTTFINNNKSDLLKKVKQFRLQYDKGYLSENVKARCCDFYLLEKKCSDYVETELEKI